MNAAATTLTLVAKWLFRLCLLPWAALTVSAQVWLVSVVLAHPGGGSMTGLLRLAPLLAPVVALLFAARLLTKIRGASVSRLEVTVATWLAVLICGLYVATVLIQLSAGVPW